MNRVPPRAARAARVARGALAGLAWIVCGLPAAAHGQTASLDGRVTDEQDGALVGATVTAVSGLLPGPAVAITDTTGAYRFPDLPAGVFTITFDLSGFQQQRHEGVALRAGTARVLSVRLALAPLSQRVDVVAMAPVSGAGVDRARVPATVAIIDGAALDRRRAVSLAQGLNEQLGAVTLADTTTNPFQPSLRFRGFTASPLLGLPQGVAVYQNGARVNEPFGDTVQFDLIPQFALRRVQLTAGTDPTFGLNALGGSLALELKNGFDAPGFRGEFSGGSFERITGTAEAGASAGPWAVYVGGTRFDETGWRAASASDVTQAVADVAYRAGRVDAGASFTFADTSLNGNGPAPVELLAADPRGVFTHPDTTENRLGFGQARFTYAMAPRVSLQASAYYRDLERRTLNGDEAEFALCDTAALPAGAPATTLCRSLAGDGPAMTGDRPASDALVDAVTGRFITLADAAGDAAFNRTLTRSTGYGGTVQVVATTRLAQRDNVFVVGAATDLSDVGFLSNGEVGTLTVDRTVDGSGLFAGVYGQAPDDEYNVGLDTDNLALGFYFSDTWSVSDRLHVTIAGRYNDVRTTIIDRLGTSLNGRHLFSRFNPSVGAVYEASPTVSVFGRYSEANRAPTSAELSCADPAEPCRVPNAFVSDPPLKQAVARSFEVGARGRLESGVMGDVAWEVAGYRTRIRDDIIFVASPRLIGTGYFQNAGDTDRVGVDLTLSGRTNRFDWYASYAAIEATFDSPLVLPSNPEVNDAASEDGELRVTPGDRIPGIPRHSLKAGVRHDLTGRWDVAVEALVASSQVFRGDEGNDQSQLDGYGVINLRSSYAVSDRLELFVMVHNLLDQDYATFGVLAEVEIDLDEAPGADDPRFVSPGVPRSAFAGFRVRF